MADILFRCYGREAEKNKGRKTGRGKIANAQDAREQEYVNSSHVYVTDETHTAFDKEKILTAHREI